MEIKLNRIYTGYCDYILYPIFKLKDDSYLCISYSSSHKIYHINVFTKDEFIEYEFLEDDSCDEYFENLTKEDFIFLK